MSKKNDFLQVVKIPFRKNRFLVILRPFFSTYWFFLELGWLFAVSTFTAKYFNGKMSSLAGLKKVIQFSAKVPILANFGYLGPPLKSIFSTYMQNFEKSSVSFLEEVVRNIVLNFGLSIFKKLRGAPAVLQIDIFQNPWF